MQAIVPVVCVETWKFTQCVWLSQDPVSCLGNSLGQYVYMQKGLILEELHIVSSGFSTGTESIRWVLGHVEIP